MHPHPELPFKMSVNARGRFTLNKTNFSRDFADREFASHSRVSAALHTPRQKSNFALVRARFHQKLYKHFPLGGAVKMGPTHINQHYYHRFTPCNRLSPLVGDFIDLCTDQQTSQCLQWRSDCQKRSIGLTFVFLHNQPIAVERLVFLSLVDGNPSRAKHDFITGSVDNFQNTRPTNDRNLLSPRFLDKSVVEQLATRVVDVIPSTLVIWEKCLGLLTHWPVRTSLVYACNVLITLC